MPAATAFPPHDGKNILAPGIGVFAPTQHDTNKLTYIARAIIWLADGTIKFGCADTSSGSITATAGYQLSLVQIDQIYDTGTDLTNAQIMCVK